MANGANAVHMQLRQALENYIKSQYFGKSPILLSALQGKLDQEGVLYQKPYIESSPAYMSKENGIQDSEVLPDWLKNYFTQLSIADLSILHPSAIRFLLWRQPSVGKICLCPLVQAPVKLSVLCGP